MLKKTIFTLNVNDYSPEITNLTYPYLQKYADRIGARFHVIKERKFPGFPVVYEKFQIYELSQQMDNDWNIYIDSDALIHPDTFDITDFLSSDTVLTCGKDFAPIRFKYDKYFRRDGRNIGVGNWFTVASSLCTDIWKPLDDLTMEEAISNIYPTDREGGTVIDSSHLIDDYVVSRNLAKYGLKFTTFIDMLEKYGNPGEFLYHEYLLTTEQKISKLNQLLQYWRDSI